MAAVKDAVFTALHWLCNATGHRFEDAILESRLAAWSVS